MNVFCVGSVFDCEFGGVWRISWLLTAFSLNAVASDRYVRIEGTVEFSAYQGTNSVTPPPFDFVCISSAGKWTVSSGFLPNAIEHFSFDRTNVYRVMEYTSVATNGIRKSPVAIANESLEQLNSKKFLTISPGPLPLQNAGINIVWLAFCSGPYLRAPNRLVPMPLCEVRHRVTAFGYEDELKLFTSRATYKSSLNDEHVRRRPDPIQEAKIKQPIPYPDGLLKFEYEVKATTNFLGWVFPLQFSYTEYTLDAEGQSQQRNGAVGRLTTIREATRPQNIFMPGMKTTINDYRSGH